MADCRKMRRYAAGRGSSTSPLRVLGSCRLKPYGAAVTTPEPTFTPDDEGAPAPARPTRLSISLTGGALDAVRELAGRYGVAEGEAVRVAIRLLKTFTEETDAGSVFRIQAPGAEPERLRLLIG